MHRRDLLRAFGAATAVAFIPRDAMAAWARVTSGIRPAAGLTDAQLALVGAVADTILPRTDSPSATDVRVPAFVDVIVSENYTDTERTAFLTGLDALNTWTPAVAGSSDTTARASRASRAFADLSNDERGAVLTAIERAPSRLKGLVIHGYFTSERVSKDVLHVEVMPGRFEGSAPLATKAASSSSREMHDHA
jgi:hypothetical protein